MKGKLNKDVFFGTSPDLPKVIEVDLDEIIPNPDQPRKSFNEDALRELASSIERYGLIQPITVKKDPVGGGYILVAGERRFRAHQLLGKSTIAAILTEGKADEIALIENIQREDLNPIETADALAQMAERYRYTQEELGKVIGKAQNTVSEYLRLNTLPPQIKDEYRTSDTVSKSVLVEISYLKTAEEQLKLWELVKNGGITVKATRAKKKQNDGKADKNDLDKSIDAGRKFLQSLIKLESTGSIQDQTAYSQLIEIRQFIDRLIDGMAGQRNE